VRRVRTLLLGIAALFACESPRDAGPSRAAPVDRETTLVDTEPAPEPVADPAFDFRRVRFERSEHVGRELACDVHYADPLAPIPPPEPEEGSRYPEDAVARTAVHCISRAAHAWIDLALDATARERASEIATGARIAVALLSPDGGFSDYPVARFVRVDGTSRTSLVDREPEPNGFDFGTLMTARQEVGRMHACAVDFASQLARVGERELRRETDYEPSVAFRMDVRCLHADGDSWVDLVFTEGEAARSLDVVRGARLDLFALTPEDGFADRPIVSLQSR
jgi:hypothetical protein